MNVRYVSGSFKVYGFSLKVKVKQPHLTSITRIVTVIQLTNLKSTVRSFYSPLAISAPFYGYLKLLKLHRTERSRNKDVTSGNRTQDLLQQGRALTDCAIQAAVAFQ